MALIKIDLSELLGEGQYVEIRDPKLLPWGEQKKIQAVLKDNSFDSQNEFAEQLTLTLAKNGNVFDEEGNAITFPLTKESIAKIPAPILEEIAKKFAEVRGKGANVPKN